MWNTTLLQKYQQSQQEVIELTDEGVKDIEAVWDDLPPTFSVICRILQDNDQGCSVYIQSAGGQSAANLPWRFCHLDEQIFTCASDYDWQVNSASLFPVSNTNTALVQYKRIVVIPNEVRNTYRDMY